MAQSIPKSTTLLLSSIIHRSAAPSLRSTRTLPRFIIPTTQTRTFRSTPANMTVHDILSEQDFKDALTQHKVVLVDFFATWCGPCKMIAPKIADWSNEFPNIYFVKVDVDDLPEISAAHGVRAMPTFKLFTDGKESAEVIGAIPPKLQALIKENHPETAEPAAAAESEAA